MSPARANAQHDVSAHELALRRAAAHHLNHVDEPDLADILRHVAERRAGRGRSGRDRSHSDQPGSPAQTPPPGGRVEGGPPGVLLESLPAGDRARILRVGRPAGFTFTAGQYVKLGVEGAPDRSFSIASAPRDPYLEFCIELIAGGTSTPRLLAATPGTRLRVGPAKGSFVLREGVRTHVMVATFTGIAPLRAMLRHALGTDRSATFVVLHGARHHDELPYRDELASLADTDQRVTYVPTVSRPSELRNAGWTGRTGRVDPLAADATSALEPGSTHVYACGNSEMVSGVRRDLGARGFDVSSETFD